MNWDELEESVLYIIGKDELIKSMLEDIKHLKQEIEELKSEVVSTE